MPPVFGPVVAVADPLEVLRRRHRHDASRRRTARAAKAPRPRGTPRPRPALPASPNRRVEEELAQRLARLSRVRRDDHALAGRQPVGLQDGRVGGAVHLRLGLLVGVEHDVRGGRHAGLAHQLLGERLAALEPRGRGARAERRAGPRPRARPRAPPRAAPPARRRSGRRARRPPARTRPSTSSAATSKQRASCAMPALPGAHSTSGARGLRRSARTIACSRPPPPTTRTLHCGSVVGDVAGDRGAEHDERDAARCSRRRRGRAP